jgi:hypothetical protein
VPIDVGPTILGIDAMIKRMDEATMYIAGDAAEIIRSAAEVLAPRGTGDNSTNATGDLARSIYVTGPMGHDGVYTSMVGPTIIYGRLRELGGTISGHTMVFVWGKYPQGYYGTIPTHPDGRVIIKHFHQKPEPYLKPAYDESLVMIETMARERVIAVLKGG